MRGVFIYVQHLLGTGHLQRMARLAAPLADRLPVSLCSGGMPVPTLDHGGAELVQLPPVRCAPGDFATLLDAAGRPVDEAWRGARRRALIEAWRSREPVLTVIESYPFARRQMRFELEPLLALAAAAPGPVVCSVRDILQPKTRAQRDLETLEALARYFDALLVHADPALCPLQHSFPRAGEIPCPVHYTGYVAPRDGPVETAGDDGWDEVLVAAGGGAVGEGLFEAALAARRRGCQAGRTWRLLVGAGPGPAMRPRLAAAAPSGVVVEPLRADYPTLLARCAVSVSQAGYNTAVDLLQAGCRAVLVPYARHREVEQSLRAARFAELGLARVVSERRLAGTALAVAIDEAIAHDPPRAGRFDLAGASNSARLLAAMAGGGA